MGISNVKITLRKVDFGNLTPEEFYKEKALVKSKALRQKGLAAFNNQYDNYKDAFIDFCDNYVFIGETLLQKVNEVENEVFRQLTKNEDGSYCFIANYNNGSNVWEDFLEEKDFN